MEIDIENKNYGLIFRDEDNDIFLGIYKNNKIKEFILINDCKYIYVDLPRSKFAFVDIQIEIKKDFNKYNIKDICTFEFKNVKKVGYVTDMLIEMNFPSEESDQLFSKLLLDAIFIDMDLKKMESN